LQGKTAEGLENSALEIESAISGLYGQLSEYLYLTNSNDESIDD